MKTDEHDGFSKSFNGSKKGPWQFTNFCSKDNSDKDKAVDAFMVFGQVRKKLCLIPILKGLI